jgi:hypothetical protein
MQLILDIHPANQRLITLQAMVPDLVCPWFSEEDFYIKLAEAVPMRCEEKPKRPFRVLYNNTGVPTVVEL